MHLLRMAPVFSFRLLLHERQRLLASVGGVTFALLLMFLQVGFRNALLDSALEMLRSVDAEIIVINKDKNPFLGRRNMPKERLFQTISVEGVASAHPMWVGLMHWKNLEDGTLHPIRVIGVDPALPVFDIDEIREAAPLLRRPGTALIDEHSRSSYGFVGTGRAEVARMELDIVGTFPLGSDFEVDGNLIVSNETWIELMSPNYAKSLRFNLHRTIEAAAVKLVPGADAEQVLESLRAILPGDVRAYSKQELVKRDLEYWRSGTPISLILLIGVALGFAVGVVICYQILYTEVLDHLAEFATLKAMGYSDRYIQYVVLVEALVLSILGFFPSVLLGAGMLGLLGLISGLPAAIGIGDVIYVGLLSVGMCSFAGVLALRKVRMLDPAELF
jgi:putative ABC transport system permease protein